MKLKLQRNDKRRSRNLTKIQVIRVTSIRRFEHYYQYAKRWLKQNNVSEAERRLQRLAYHPKDYSKPWMQGHYQQAWNANRHANN